MKHLKTINDHRCYFCGRTDHLQVHHIYPGFNRKKCEEDGLCVWLCLWHHTGSNDAVHVNYEKELHLKKVGQAIFEIDHTREQFRARYGKSYL